MKNFIFVMLFGVFLILPAAAPAATQNYTYRLDILIPDPQSIPDPAARIGGVEFRVLGGVFGSDWFAVLGNAIPQNQGNWVFENYGAWNALYDDYNWSLPSYAPMLSGTVLSITSVVELLFSDMGFYDFKGRGVSESYFATGGFTMNPVPVPASMILFLSGLLSIWSIRRGRE